MNLLDQVKERKDKVLAFLKENPNNDVLETEFKIIINDADVSEMKKLAQKEGKDCLRYEAVLNRWYFCKTEYNTACITICVWSKHTAKNAVTSDTIDQIFETI